MFSRVVLDIWCFLVYSKGYGVLGFPVVGFSGCYVSRGFSAAFLMFLRRFCYLFVDVSGRDFKFFGCSPVFLGFCSCLCFFS